MTRKRKNQTVQFKGQRSLSVLLSANRAHKSRRGFHAQTRRHGKGAELSPTRLFHLAPANTFFSSSSSVFPVFEEPLGPSSIPSPCASARGKKNTTYEVSRRVEGCDLSGLVGRLIRHRQPAQRLRVAWINAPQYTYLLSERRARSGRRDDPDCQTQRETKTLQTPSQAPPPPEGAA